MPHNISNPADSINGDGITLFNNGQVEEAIGVFSKGIAQFSNSPELYCNRANCFCRLGDFEMALQDYNKSIAIRQDYAEGYGNRGMLFYRVKQFDDAYDDFTRAIQYDPNDPIHYYNRGNILRRRGEYELALKDYDKAIDLNPNFSVVFTMRAAAHFECEDYDKAISDSTRSIVLDASEKSNLLIRGKAYFKKGDLLSAIDDLLDYLKDEPNNTDCLAYLVKLYKFLKQHDTAYQLLVRIGEIDGLSFDNIYDRAECLEEIKNFPLAIKHWNVIIENDPQNEKTMEVFLRRGQCFMEVGDFANAEKDFQTVISSSVDTNNELKEKAIQRKNQIKIKI